VAVENKYAQSVSNMRNQNGSLFQKDFSVNVNVSAH